MCDLECCLLHQDMYSLLSSNHVTYTLSRETSKAGDVPLLARSLTKYPNCVTTWTAVHFFSFQSHVNQMPHSWHRAKACCVMRLRGEA